MFFTLQSDVSRGFQRCEPRLRAHVEALLETDDWSLLERETQAIGLVLGVETETRRWIEALAAQDPARALDLALRASRYSFVFGRGAKGFGRVLVETPARSVGALPTPEFWRELRRASWDSPNLQHELAALAASHRDAVRPLRAGLAFLFPADDGWWSAKDAEEGLHAPDAETGALALLALSRHEPHAMTHVTWPPPAYALRGLGPQHQELALRWCPRSYVAPLEERPTGQTIANALRRGAEPMVFPLLAQLKPDAALLKRIKSYARAPGAAVEFIRQVLVTTWEAELEQPGPLLPLRALNGAVLRDGRTLTRLRGALRAKDLGTIDAFRALATPESLGQFASALFVRWLLEGSLPDGGWVLRGLIAFPTDLAAETLGELADDGRTVHALSFVEALRQMSTRASLLSLSRLAHGEDEVAAPLARRTLGELAVAHLVSAEDFEDALFPAVELPAGTAVVLDVRGVPVLVRDGQALPWPDALRPCVRALRPALARLEERMALGPPMPSLTFTETWGLNPLLHAVAAGLVWGVFRDGARVGWFVPSSGAEQPQLREEDGVRPLHPLELTREERLQAKRLLPRRQPFDQLKRPVFVAGEDTRVSLGPFALLQMSGFLRRRGWQAESLEGPWRLERDGWEASFHVDWDGGTLEVRGAPSPRVYSELFRELCSADRRRNVLELV